MRTSNFIEHFNKEFKRRTKPMGIVTGERFYYALLAFVCVKMEIHWRKRLIGKVLTNLSFLKKFYTIKLTAPIYYFNYMIDFPIL